MRAVLRFLDFPAEERRMLVLLLPLLVQARIGVRIAGVPAARRATGRLAPRSSIRPERLAQLLNVAVQRLPGLTHCLPRAIVLEALLKKEGRLAELRVGVAPLRGAIRPDAHAWVELDGVAVAETVDRYTALPIFGARG